MNMSIRQPINLSTSGKEELKQFIDQFDVIFCDCDGVLYLHNKVIDNSNKLINYLIENDKKVYLLTNNAQNLREEMLERYQKLGFNINIENVLTSSYLTAKYLSTLNFEKKVFVIGSEKIGQELKKFQIPCIEIGDDPMIQGSLAEYVADHYELDPEVGAVVVSLDPHFSLPKLLKAMNYLLKPDMLFLATNPDDRAEFPGFVFPDAGPFIAAIERGSNRKATIIGKPSILLCKFIDLPENKDKILMIGDRLNTDIAFGINAGFKTLLVETGDHKLEDVEKAIKEFKVEGNKDECFIPDFVISSLGKFCEAIS